MSNHDDTLRPGEMTRNHECPVCHQWYNSYDHLKSHYDTSHPEYEALETITRRYSEVQPRFAFQCTECGQLFHGADDLIQHYRDNHPEAGEAQQRDTSVIDLRRPIYEGKILTYKAGDQILWMERIADLERQVAELRARMDAMEAGK